MLTNGEFRAFHTVRRFMLTTRMQPGFSLRFAATPSAFFDLGSTFDEAATSFLPRIEGRSAQNAHRLGMGHRFGAGRVR